MKSNNESEFPDLDGVPDPNKPTDRSEEWDRECWLRVMDTPEGAHVLRSILAETYPYRTTYTRGDAMETAYREGKRAVGLWLMAKMGEVDSALGVSIVHSNELKEQR